MPPEPEGRAPEWLPTPPADIRHQHAERTLAKAWADELRFVASFAFVVTNWMPRLAVLAIATSLLAACATARSDGGGCPPVPAYSREFLARAAGEVGKLPAGSAVEQMLGDYGVVRAQARACRG